MKVHTNQGIWGCGEAVDAVGGIEVDSRSSDAIALAIRTNAEVVAPEDLLESAGITIAETADDEVERFKEFLDHVSPEDFE